MHVDLVRERRFRSLLKNIINVYNFHKAICLLMIILSDMTALLFSYLIAYFVRSMVLPNILSGPIIPPLPLSTQLRYGFIFNAIIIIVVFFFEKLYTKRFTFWEETRHLLKGITLSFVLIMTAVFISRGYTQYSRAVILMAWGFSLLLFPFSRLAIKKILVLTGLWRKKVLILGTNGIAKLSAEEIERNDTLGYKVVGYLTNDKKKIGQDFGKLKVIGKIGDVEKISRDLRIKDVIIALSKISQQKLIELLESCENSVETIRMIPNVGHIFPVGVEIENLGDVLSLSVARNLVKPWNIYIKRLFEFIIVLILSIIFFPLILIISVAIKIDSPGSILYAQERLGKDDKRFNCYKFRSMYVDNENKLAKFLKENQKAQKEWERYQKIKNNDPRVTRIGKVIRKYSLDEIPQLINFFRRDMNLIGPRPYMPREIEKIGRSYQIISRVKPGITGLWQVRGRNILPFKERLLLDEYYIRNWSIWLDIVILLKTIRVFITRKGAY